MGSSYRRLITHSKYGCCTCTKKKRMKRPLMFYALVLSFSCYSVCAKAQENHLTAEHIISLMEASRERYVSCDSKMSLLCYKEKSEDNNDINITAKMEIISRHTRERAFSIRKLEHRGRVETLTYASTQKYVKLMSERTDLPDNINGRITPTPEMTTSSSFFTINDAMWDLFGCPWDRLNIEEASFMEKNGLYILTIPVIHKTPKILTLHVDPAKGFTIRKGEFSIADGTTLFRMECTDFRETKDGLWVPHSYTWSHPKDRVFNKYSVEEVTINGEIPDEDLDFAFKDGTYVIDLISNMEYRIGPGDYPVENNTVSTSNEPPEINVVRAEDIKLAEPVTDQRLTEVAQQLSKQNGTLINNEKRRPKKIVVILYSIAVLVIIVTLLLIVRKRSYLKAKGLFSE